MGGQIKIDQAGATDDIYPQRKERIGQYLADYTSETMANGDIRGGGKNAYPVYPPGENTKGFTEVADKRSSSTSPWNDENLNKALSYFNDLSNDSAFAAGEVPETLGHNFLQVSAPEVVANSIANQESRWAGIGQQKFPPNTGEDNEVEMYQVQKTSGTENLDNTGASGETYFETYKHPHGLTSQDAFDDPSHFWDHYFERMAIVGAKITLEASGRSAPSEEIKLGSFTDLGKGEDGLEGNYRKRPIDHLRGKNVFFDRSEDPAQPNAYYENTLKGEFLDDLHPVDNINVSKPLYNDSSWGQMNSWDDQFEFENLLGLPKSLPVAGQFLEIVAAVALRVLASTAILQTGAWGISEADKALGGKGAWNNAYYPPDPQIKPGSDYFQGHSGYNHPSTDLVKQGLEHVSASEAAKEGDGGSLVVAQLGMPVLNVIGEIAEKEVLNILTHIQREINIYIPRHILSTMANETGYNGGGLITLAKGLDIATAYTRAFAAGALSMAVVVGVGDYGKSLGFWKSLFRTIVRSKSQHAIRKPTHGVFDDALRFCGKDDKLMKFANYLAMIGDLGTAHGYAGNIAFPENKVPLSEVGNFPTLRTVGGRKKGHKTKSRLSLTDTPSLMLIPSLRGATNTKLQEYGIEEAGPETYGVIEGSNDLWRADEDTKKAIGAKYQANSGNRFSPEQVRMIEDQLEGEHMPFYIQDLRTNEVISFHAFLTSLSDSYTAEWSAQKGFGRLEAAQIYGGGSRAIGVSFSMVPMNKEDFDEMWYKINKLTTLVYPQWSEGTKMQSGDNIFIQPFSQVPTASPLCRLRVGDLFTSNYSKVAMARMMGIAHPEFVYNEPNKTDKKPIKDDEEPIGEIDKLIGEQRYVSNKSALNQAMKHWGFGTVPAKVETKKKWEDNPVEFVLEFNPNGETTSKVPGDLLGLGPNLNFGVLDKEQFIAITKPVTERHSGLGATSSAGLASLFQSSGETANPILKSFESSMGRGIAVAVTGITFDWKLNSTPWNLEPGHRAPRMCDVQLSIVPIHDITPGLDHQGINRAPIYKVGDKSKSLTGDAWHNSKNYNELTSEISKRTEAYLAGETKSLKPKGTDEEH